MSRRFIGLSLAILACCAGGQKHTDGHGDLSQFECNGRRIEYMVAGGFVATEAGVRMECEGENPRLTRWRLEDSGARASDTFALSAEQFDSTWEKVDSTGWRFLDEKCVSSSADGDPIYTVDVSDHSKTVSLYCAGKELPFPYDRLVNELDLRAAGFGDDSGAAP